jgi:6-hydroxynicotinate reductase
MPENAFGYVPTPALVAPIEFTLKKEEYAALGGHMDYARPLREILREKQRQRQLASLPENPWPLKPPPEGDPRK